MCPLEANVYGIVFLEFSIRDYDTRRSLFTVASSAEEEGSEPLPSLADLAASGLDEATLNEMRTIRYDFNVDVLRLPRIGTS